MSAGTAWVGVGLHRDPQGQPCHPRESPLGWAQATWTRGVGPRPRWAVGPGPRQAFTKRRWASAAVGEQTKGAGYGGSFQVRGHGAEPGRCGPRCSPTAVTVFLILRTCIYSAGEPRGATTTPFHSSAPPPQSIRKLSPSFPSGCTEARLQNRAHMVGGGRGRLLSILESQGQGSGGCSLYLKSVLWGPGLGAPSLS